MAGWCVTENFNETIDRQVLESNDFGVEPDGTKEVLLEKVVENMLEERLVKTALCLGDELAVFMETREVQPGSS